MEDVAREHVATLATIELDENAPAVGLVIEKVEHDAQRDRRARATDRGGLGRLQNFP
jgi:hypothetical protein